MKKVFFSAMIVSLLTACASERHDRTIAQINTERNDQTATVTTASLEQARKQRQQELEESILARQKAALKNQEKAEGTDVILRPISSILCALTGCNR